MERELVIHVGPSRCFIEYGNIDSSYRYFVESELKTFCKRELTNFKYNFRNKTYELHAQYFKKDPKEQVWYFPGPFRIALESHLTGAGFKVTANEYDVHTPRKMHYENNPKFIARGNQQTAIDFLTKSKNTRSGLELQTGKGKTFCALRAAHNMGDVTMIVVEGLVQQWYDAIKEQTMLDSDKVQIIQGFPSLNKFLKSDKKPDIFIMSLATLRKYVKNEGKYSTIIPYSEFVEYYQIGTKIVDEAHKCLHANSLIDMAGDIPTNIYLTATFLTGDRMLSKIFHAYFPNQMRYDDGYDKYCEVFGYSYRGLIRAAKTIQFGVYSHGRFEKLMLWSKQKLFNLYMERYLIPLIKTHYIKKDYVGKKVLIFFALKRMIREVAKYLQKTFPEYKVRTFIEDDPESNLEEGEILLSTHKGAGTGRDIKNLVTVINTISFLAETTTRQVLGRLRELPNGDTPTYVDIYDFGNHIQLRHWRIRSNTLRQCAKSFREFSL